MLFAQELLGELRERHARLQGIGSMAGKPPLEFKPLAFGHGKGQRLRFGPINQRLPQRIFFSWREVLQFFIDCGVHL
jgi:hypothetical protein